MAYTILSESYGRRLPKITAEADSTDDLIDLGTNYAEGSACNVGGVEYALDKVQGWVIGGGSETVPKIPSVSFGESTVIVDTTTVSFAKDGENAWYISATNPVSGMTFEQEKLYRVTWDGVEYDVFSTTHYPLSSSGAGNYLVSDVGNIGVLGLASPFSTDAPFVISKGYKQAESKNIYILTSSTEASHTIKVEEIPFSAQIVDEQYYKDVRYGRPIGFFATSGTKNGPIIIGCASKSEGNWSVAMGCGTEATGNSSLAIGANSKANGASSFASGVNTTASGAASHTEGILTVASGLYAHAEGMQNTASGMASHAEGASCSATGNNSHADGKGTIANHLAQHTFGTYNVADPSNSAVDAKGTYVEIVGNGDTKDARSNARTLDWSGNEELAGSITLGKGTADEVTLTAAQLKALLALLN